MRFKHDHNRLGIMLYHNTMFLILSCSFLSVKIDQFQYFRFYIIDNMIKNTPRAKVDTGAIKQLSFASFPFAASSERKEVPVNNERDNTIPNWLKTQRHIGWIKSPNF